MVRECIAADGSISMLAYRRPSGYLLRFPGSADFDVDREADVVTAVPACDAAPERIEVLFQNQVLPLIASLEGRLVLHASAVALDGVAVAFLGSSGRGKSTLAASFAAAGLPFLAEDSFEVDFRDGSCRAFPSALGPRLWADSAAAVLGAAPDADAEVKARHSSCGALPHCERPLPLAMLYLLGDGSADAPLITPVARGAAVPELIAHSFIMDGGDRRILAAHFAALARLADGVACARLDFPREYESLEAVRTAIVVHAGQPRLAA